MYVYMIIHFLNYERNRYHVIYTSGWWRLNLDRVTWNSRRHCNINALNYTPRFELLVTTGQYNTVMITILLQYHSNCHNNITRAGNAVRDTMMFIHRDSLQESLLNDLIFFIPRVPPRIHYFYAYFSAESQKLPGSSLSLSLRWKYSPKFRIDLFFSGNSSDVRGRKSNTSRAPRVSRISRRSRRSSFVAAPDDLEASRRRHPRLVDSRNVVAGARRVAYLSRPSLPERVFHLSGDMYRVSWIYLVFSPSAADPRLPSREKKFDWSPNWN